MDTKVENFLPKGLLVLDFDQTTVNEDLIVFPDLIKILAELHERGIEIVILTARNWSEAHSKALDDAFGKKRNFLAVPQDIYDVDRCSKHFFKGIRQYTKGDALEKIAADKGYPREIVVFVDDSKEHIDSAKKANFPALQVIPKGKYNPTPQDNFFTETLLSFCRNTFCLSDYLKSLPEDVVKHIISFLPLRTSPNYYAINQLMWKAKPAIFPDFIENFDSFFCVNILREIEVYVQKFKAHCHFHDQIWRKDYGFVRAMGFKIIFATPEQNAMGECAAKNFKLLALYLLLTEKNGVNLKLQVETALPNNIIAELKHYLLKAYKMDEKVLTEGINRLLESRDSLCKQIHPADLSQASMAQGVLFLIFFKGIHDELLLKAVNEEDVSPKETCIIS